MNTLPRLAVLPAFLAACVSGAALAESFYPPKGEVILTIEGNLTATNVGDTLQLDREQLASLPQTSFVTKTIWTSGEATFSGVLLKDLVKAIGATGTTISMRAINEYTISMPTSDVGDDAPLLAFLMDGKPMSLRDKGPLWMVYPYDAKEEYRTEQTYSRSIWQLKTLDFRD